MTPDLARTLLAGFLCAGVSAVLDLAGFDPLLATLVALPASVVLAAWLVPMGGAR